jgi:hypothetical protein
VPEFEFGWWLVIILGAVAVLIATWRIIWDLMQPETERKRPS